MRNMLTGLFTAALLLSAAGCCCQKDKASAQSEGYNDPFFPASATHVFDNAAYQQQCSAARRSSTLWDMHFHGAALNSLGEQKLGLMYDDDDKSTPHTLYLDTTGDDVLFASRVQSVQAFMTQNGLDAQAVKIERGSNPHYTTSSAPLLKNLAKTDTEGDTGSIGGGSK